MAGVKGRSGGPRPNSGGARPGAGRPKKQPEEAAKTTFDAVHADPKQFLLDVMNDLGLDAKLRIDAAKCLMPFVHQKLGEGGKKEQQHEAAKKVASKFAAALPPKLVVNNKR